MSNSEGCLSKKEIILTLFVCLFVIGIIILLVWLIADDYNRTLHLKQENCIKCCMLKCIDNYICADECFKLCNDYKIYREECYNHPNMTITEVL